MSSLIIAARIIILIAVVVTCIIKQRNYNVEQWILRCFGIIWQFLLIVLTYKFPQKFSEYHAGLLVISFPLHFINVIGNKSYVNAIINNVIGFGFFMISGLVTNNKWYFTALLMTFTLIGTILFYVLFINYYEFATLMQFCIITLLSIISAYQNELKFKTEFIQYA